ncbi:pyridoxamine 5'-phosphate oxidase family protein [Couchioplanes caeruleus]|uniref:Pyridoxamine 5'-phosphate oxidase n=2 Tax=Couchioplanes caeruleus TaxID=56438 RepID=A0A1K0FJS6_9ACTN|nr:pyridoxamine 5'-phosphate oxidase family protein [Couchioplanes caeruleus]OJF13101.1 pyridoxamine 5'-phosphate oxidase [Couchioplanes caeruleus subsp. caeruleus]ROP30405.1 pyridoxamine 5'-phosphate oxidase [Couchioplanes caeruleus]
MTPEPRSGEQRKHDILERLTEDVDAWVATADAAGMPHLVPLSFLWDGAALTFATAGDSPAGRNLRDSGRARVALGHTRDVVLIDGAVEVLAAARVPDDLADAFAAKLWDARAAGNRWTFFRVTPDRILAWREENELPGRVMMRDGSWVV